MNHDQPRSPFGFGFPVGGVFRAALDAVIIMDHEGRVRDWNPAAEALFGCTRDDALGREVAELIIPPPMRDAHRNGLRRYLETGASRMLDRRLEFTAMTSDGSEVAVELAVTRVPDADPPLFVGFIRALRERLLSALDSVRLQQRMAFLAQAGLVLDRSLDYNETLRALADLTVPDLAQMTVIDLLDERGVFEMTVASSEHRDQAAALEATRDIKRLDLQGPHPVAVVLRSGRPHLVPAMSSEFLREISQGKEHFDLMQRLRYHSAIVVPLIARGRTLGTLSLLRMEGSASYNEDDLALAEELARRAALAVDNARLFESTRHLALTLQQSLLPYALPELPGVRITDRYRPAEHAYAVGGDFYDVFPLGPNAWAITIGDVSGKGAEAAALTSLARYTVRAYADTNPSTVLRRLNEAVIRERDVIQDRFLSALYAVASVGEGSVVFDIATAGHPTPLVIRGDGHIEAVAVPGPLIGLTEATTYLTERVVLAPGERMLLYTDGLTDSGAPARILSEADLVELLARGSGLTGDELATFILQQATGGHGGRDDIAMLLIELEGRDGTVAPGAGDEEARQTAPASGEYELGVPPQT